MIGGQAKDEEKGKFEVLCSFPLSNAVGLR